MTALALALMSLLVVACGSSNSTVDAALSKKEWQDFYTDYSAYADVFMKSKRAVESENCPSLKIDLEAHECLLRVHAIRAEANGMLVKAISNAVSGASGICRERLIAWEAKERSLFDLRINMAYALAAEANDEYISLSDAYMDPSRDSRDTQEAAFEACGK